MNQSNFNSHYHPHHQQHHSVRFAGFEESPLPPLPSTITSILPPPTQPSIVNQLALSSSYHLNIFRSVSITPSDNNDDDKDDGGGIEEKFNRKLNFSSNLQQPPPSSNKISLCDNPNNPNSWCKSSQNSNSNVTSAANNLISQTSKYLEFYSSRNLHQRCTSYNHDNHLNNNLTLDSDNADNLSHLSATGSLNDDDEEEEQSEEERLASLEALRYALHHAPFCKNMHTLMSVPNEESYEMIGIPTKCAIRIEQLCYRSILDNVNLEIPKGKIYSILGSSNNGKSLLLKLILGREKPTSGTIDVFGQKPSNQNPLSAICVGYMPQRIALHPELSIQQTLQYYSHLYQLPSYMICERVRNLDSMFDGVDNGDNADQHPITSFTLVKQLNESNLWRLSLMIAMIHSPPLLLLDEPTDNVDPLVRAKLWTYLEKLCEDEGLTIVFTTKHPEELCYAYKAGLIRDGHVYIEDRPEELLRNYHSLTYIQMYNKFCMSNIPRRIRPSIAPYLAALQLSLPSQLSMQTSIHSRQSDDNSNCLSLMEKVQQQEHELKQEEEVTFDNFSDFSDFNNNHNQNHNHNKNNGGKQSDSTGSYSADGSMDIQRLPLPMAEWPIAERRRTAYISHAFNLDLKRLFALVLKNLNLFQGNFPRLALFYFMFPVLQILMICFIFGRSAVKNIPVMIMTKAEDLNNDRMEKFVRYTIDSELFQTKTIYKTLSLEQIQQGRSVATIVPWSIEQLFNNSTFLASTSHRFNSNSNDNDEDEDNLNDDICEKWLKYSKQNQLPFYGLKLYVDHSNYFYYQQMNFSLSNSMRNLMANDEQLQSLFPEDCPDLYQSMKTLIDIDLIRGDTEFRFLEFLLPGFLISIIFAHSLVLTAYLFIKEQLAGLQERCMIAGATPIEILTSHMISQTIIFLLQEIILMIILIKLFGVPSRGPMIYPWSLIFLQGFLGIVAGLFVAVIYPRPISAALFTSAIFIPGFFLSGITWPIESMPIEMSYISLILPLTLPINALRFIISDGPMHHRDEIFAGYSVTTVYIVMLSIFTIIIFKLKTS